MKPYVVAVAIAVVVVVALVAVAVVVVVINNGDTNGTTTTTTTKSTTRITTTMATPTATTTDYKNRTLNDNICFLNTAYLFAGASAHRFNVRIRSNAYHDQQW